MQFLDTDSRNLLAHQHVARLRADYQGTHPSRPRATATSSSRHRTRARVGYVVAAVLAFPRP